MTVPNHRIGACHASSPGSVRYFWWSSWWAVSILSLRWVWSPAHAHLRGTVLAMSSPTTYMGGVRILLLKCFQLRDLLATYKAQIWPRQRYQSGDIYSYVEALQWLTNLVFTVLDYHAREEIVIDQFLPGMGNHELSIQVAAHGHRRVEDIVWVACSLETIHKEENIRTCSHKPNRQVCSIVNEHNQYQDAFLVVYDCDLSLQ